jgi:hypothetical protein
MIEGSGPRKDSRLERDDGAGCNGDAINHRRLRRRQPSREVVPNTQRAMDRYLSTFVCIASGRVGIAAADAEFMGRRCGRPGGAGDQHAGQDDVENESVGRNERSRYAHPSSENEPRHPLDPRGRGSTARRGVKFV